MATELHAAEVRCRIDVDLKARATAVLDASGLSISDAMRLFLRKVVEVEVLPIQIFHPLSFASGSAVRVRWAADIIISHNGCIQL